MAAPLAEAGRPAEALELQLSVIDESTEPAMRGSASAAAIAAGSCTVSSHAAVASTPKVFIARNGAFACSV